MVFFLFVICRCLVFLKLEIYDGIDDWDEYQCYFQVCVEFGNWNEREKVFVLFVSLRGVVCIFFMSLIVLERQNYDLFVMKLSQRFGSLR